MNYSLDYIGHPHQLYGAVPYQYAQGKAKGVKAIAVKKRGRTGGEYSGRQVS